MDLLHRLFELAARPGIIGPHGTQEADLLIAGVKPVGFISIIDEDPVAEDSVQKKFIDDVKRLDEEVTKGNLLSKTIRIDNFKWPNGLTGGLTVYLYCQPNKNEDMKLLADNHEKYWKDGIEEDLPQDIGKYLGYTDKDVELFNNGGYASLNPIYRFLMQHTHDIRQRCRVKSLLNCSEPKI